MARWSKQKADLETKLPPLTTDHGSAGPDWHSINKAENPETKAQWTVTWDTARHADAFNTSYHKSEPEAIADELAGYGLSTTVADARFAKPLDGELVERLAREHEVLITIEEGSIGGFGSHVLHHLANAGMLDHGLKVRPMVLPDRFIDHDSPAVQYEQAGLNARHITQTALAALGRAAAERSARA